MPDPSLAVRKALDGRRLAVIWAFVVLLGLFVSAVVSNYSIHRPASAAEPTLTD